MFTEEQLYQLSLKAYRDNENAMEYMFQKGFEEGLKEARQEGQFEARTEIAKWLKQINFSDEDIIEVTRLTREEIEKL